MNKLKWLFGGFLLVCGLSGMSQASVVARMPKAVYTQSYTTVLSSVTAFSVLQATSTLEAEPGAIYQLNMSSGAASEYIIFYDTIPFNTTTLTSNPVGGQVYELGPRFFYGSTTANTNVVFDPPLLFKYGLMVIDSSAAGQFSISYELGRGINGQ